MADLEISSALVFGLGITGKAVARGLHSRGVELVLADDRGTEESRGFASEVGAVLVESPSQGRLARLIDQVDVVLPSPGVPAAHPVYRLAESHGTPIIGEFDLAAMYDQRPIAAITGTNGKTTVTMLTRLMLDRSGRIAVAAGNVDLPLVAAIDDPATEVFVVEASSFRLEHSQWFAPQVATWLNLAPDHLDWHATHGEYGDAKARIWRNQAPTDVAVVNADDPAVMAYAASAPSEVQSFSIKADAETEYRVDYDQSQLIGPSGPIVSLGDLTRRLPHDLANALAASATALAAGATLRGVQTALREFTGLPHRVATVAEVDGVTYVNDSKATAPHATAAAVEGFDSVVLIAGGRNKGLDLSVLRDSAARLRAVVAIGESAADVEAAFRGLVETRVAASMDDAVDAARSFAQPGDVVLLSPVCASFDWYGGYAERGDDFVRSVTALAARQ